MPFFRLFAERAFFYLKNFTLLSSDKHFLYANGKRKQLWQADEKKTPLLQHEPLFVHIFAEKQRIIYH